MTVAEPAVATFNHTTEGAMETVAIGNEAAAGTGSHPAPDQATRAVWGALTANPGTTAANIAAVADMSKTAVRRALASLENDGYAVRTPGGRDGGKRAPDTWDAAPPGNSATTTTYGADASDAQPVIAAETTTAETDPPSSSESEPDSSSDVTSDADTGVSDEPGGTETMDATAINDASQALADLAQMITSTMESLAVNDRTGALTAAETIYSGSGKVRRLVKTAANGRPRGASGKARSYPGELQAKVATHLVTYPGTQFTPHEIAKAIGHSAGAVTNALDRLTALDKATLTCERPRRYTAGTTP